MVNKAKTLARLPHAVPCRPCPPNDKDGKIIFKGREAPGVRWAYIDDNNGGGPWCWLCDECGKTVSTSRQTST
eukprot:8333731-Pyramimonas_sp.AAC.1